MNRTWQSTDLRHPRADGRQSHQHNAAPRINVQKELENPELPGLSRKVFPTRFGPSNLQCHRDRTQINNRGELLDMTERQGAEQSGLHGSDMLIEPIFPAVVEKRIP